MTWPGLGHIAETGRYSSLPIEHSLTGSIGVNRDIMSRQVGLRLICNLGYVLRLCAPPTSHQSQYCQREKSNI